MSKIVVTIGYSKNERKKKKLYYQLYMKIKNFSKQMKINKLTMKMIMMNIIMTMISDTNSKVLRRIYRTYTLI